MIKDLLFVVDNATHAEPFLRRAISLGEAFGAHCEVVALSASPLASPKLAPFGGLYVPDGVLKEDATALMASVRKLVADATVPFEVYGLRDDVAWIPYGLRLNRPVADLCVASPAKAWEIPWLGCHVMDTLLLSTGTPLLVLPAERELGRIRHAVVGWKQSPQAVRAVHDLVAIAEPGARIDIVSVTEEDGPAAGASLTELQRHLIRHGFSVSAVTVFEEDWSSTTEALQRHAEDQGADLLVTGAYVHTRLREAVLGGVTRKLIMEARVPALLSN